MGTEMKGTTYHVWARVGPRVKYGLWPHSGTRPHVIRARRKKVMIFPWPDGPRHIVIRTGKWAGYAFLPKVNHPGQKAQRYLTRPLVGIGRANGFWVSTKRTIG